MNLMDIEQSIETNPFRTMMLLILIGEVFSTILTSLFPTYIPIEYSDSFSILILLTLSSIYYHFSIKTIPQLLMLICIFLWGIRLGAHLVIRTIEGFRDKRIDKFRNSLIGKLRWTNAHTLWIGCLMFPVAVTMTTKLHYTSFLIFTPYILFCTGFIMETLADYQKSMFIKSNKSLPSDKRKPFTDIGLFRYCRFPNYFGEIHIWLSLSLAAFLVTNSSIRYILPITPWLIFQVLDKLSVRMAIKSVKERCTDEQFKQWSQLNLYLPTIISPLDS